MNFDNVNTYKPHTCQVKNQNCINTFRLCWSRSARNVYQTATREKNAKKKSKGIEVTRLIVCKGYLVARKHCDRINNGTNKVKKDVWILIAGETTHDVSAFIFVGNMHIHGTRAPHEHRTWFQRLNEPIVWSLVCNTEHFLLKSPSSSVRIEWKSFISSTIHSTATSFTFAIASVTLRCASLGSWFIHAFKTDILDCVKSAMISWGLFHAWCIWFYSLRAQIHYPHFVGHVHCPRSFVVYQYTLPFTLNRRRALAHTMNSSRFEFDFICMRAAL